jgi:hypothetical protein
MQFVEPATSCWLAAALFAQNQPSKAKGGRDSGDVALIDVGTFGGLTFRVFFRKRLDAGAVSWLLLAGGDVAAQVAEGVCCPKSL